jgi:hypothetical protein
MSDKKQYSRLREKGNNEQGMRNEEGLGWQRKTSQFNP